MKTLKNILFLALVLGFASCQKLAEPKERHGNCEQSNTPKASAISTHDSPNDDNGGGITDPDHDEDHDKDGIKKLN